MLALLVSAVALAATPNPDRPTVSQTPALTATKTLEIEAGAAWAGDFGAPLLVKYGAGWIEPRVGVDPLAFGPGGAAVSAGVKMRILTEPKIRLSGALASAVPLEAGIPWTGTARLLGLVPIEGGALTVNAGVDLAAPDGMVSVVGMPVAVAYGFGISDVVGAFVEGATVVDQGLRDSVLDGGLSFVLTDSLLLDTAVGWSLATGQPMAQLGFTANLGRIGG